MLELQKFTQIFDRYLLELLNIESNYYKQIGPVPLRLLSEIKRMIESGGKRIRPAQLYYSFLGCGGVDKKMALDVATSIELLHTFAIIHDDIIDKSTNRRGHPTVQQHFRDYHKRNKLAGDQEHFSLSQTILAGDLALTLADKALTDIPWKLEIRKDFKKSFDRLRLEVVAGEAMDVYWEYINKIIGEKKVLKILKYKTGLYTSGRPLELGAILAGAPSNTSRKLLKIGTLTGIAFQIQDDILGVFGKEEVIGKSTDSDLLEGKKTLLIAYAFEKADEGQKKILKNTLGNPQASANELKKVREIIKETGALKRSVQKAMTLISKAHSELEGMELKKEGKEFLLKMAIFMLEREL